MKNKKSETLPEDAATSATLCATWFQRLDIVYQSITENSALECATRCSARCCPKSKALKNIDDAVGHVAIMLPFEMEYIRSKTNINPSQFQYARIEFTPDTAINIGFMTSEVPCPFLTANNQCGIYNIRPLDCRSFPLIPVFNPEGTINFRVDKECPSAMTFSITYQTQLKKVWKELLPSLPMSYRMLYNQL